MVSYQGNKGEYSTRICNIIRERGNKELELWDVCCGSGQISAFWPKPNHMVDIGPWGRFWKTIHGDPLILPTIMQVIKGKTHAELGQLMHMAKMQPVPESGYLYAMHFIILQTFAFNGKPVQTHGSTWKHPGFPTSWTMTKIWKELERIERTKIKSAHHMDANLLTVSEPAKVYIDPDYKGTQGYGHSESARGGRVNHSISVHDFVSRHPHCELFVSHHENIEGVEWTEVLDITIPTARRIKQSKELLHYKRS